MLKENSNQEKRPILESYVEITNYKRIFLFIFGCFGLYLFSFLIGLGVKTLPYSPSEKNGIATFLVYSVLFLVLILTLGKDVLKFIKTFKNWKGVLIGLAFGAGMIIFPIAYDSFVNLFYPIKVNENEGSLRSFITIYPFASLFILGIIGPICEELTYRVGLFGIFGKHKVLGYIVAILIFAFMHFDFESANIINELINLPSYLVSAALLTVAYDRFGFECSLVAHSANNLFSVASVIILSLL